MQIGKNASVKIMFLALSLTAVPVLLLSCQSSDEAAPAEVATEAAPADCAEPFSRTIEPISISGGHHLYFDPATIALFSDPALRIQSVDLNTTIQGKAKGTPFEFPLAVNGIQTSGRDGSSIYELLGYASQSDLSVIRHRIHKMVVNGSDPIQNFMLKIVRNNGSIKLSLQGKDLHVLGANIEVRGISYAGCSNPDPEPTPTPTLPAQAPVTSIMAAEPSDAVTSSGIISISFTSDQLGSSFTCSLDGAAPTACASPQAYSNLGDGDHVFKVFAQNAAGLADPVGATYSWHVDSLLPGATLENVSQLPSITQSTSIEFSFSKNNALGFLCSIDGGEFLPCTSPVAYSGLNEGSHTFSVTSVGGMGAAPNPVQFQWVIDLTAPTTSIINVDPAASVTNANMLSIAFMSDESATFECALDSTDFSACASPFAAAELAEGAHEFQVRARDIAGNLGNAISYSWISDYTAPAVSLIQALPAAGLSNAHAVSVEFGSNEVATFQCSFDTASFEACSSPFVAPILEAGNHALAVVAIDAAGNRSAELRLEWLMDFLAPEISFFEILPSSSKYLNSSWLQASIFSTEPVSLAATLNTAALLGDSSPILVSGLAEGPYNLVVNATDQTGNAAAPIAHAFTIDRTLPSVTLSGEHSGDVTNATSNTLSFSAGEEVSFECQLNGAGFAACASPLQVSGLAEGNHGFEVRAIDLAGNVSAIRSVTWDVDLTAPAVSLSSNRTGNTTIDLVFSANEAPVTFVCSLDGAAFSSCSSPSSLAGLSVGAHSFAVKAQDTAGNVSVPVSESWTVEPPVTTYISSVSPGSSPTRQNSISIVFGSSAGTSFRCSLNGGAPVGCTSPMTYSGLGDGTQNFSVYAIDHWGNADPIGASYSWVVDTTPPVPGTISTVTTATSITINWTTNEPSSRTINWGVGYDTSRVVAPNGSFVTTHSVKLVGLMPNTLYSFVITGADFAGNTYTTVKKSIRTNY